MFIDAAFAELKGGKAVDRAALERMWREHEKKFANSVDSDYARQPAGDYFAMSRMLFKRYFPMVPKAAASSGHQ